MKHIFGQWVDHSDDDKQIYYFYKVKDNMYTFHHWESSDPWREYFEESGQFKQYTTFKVTLTY